MSSILEALRELEEDRGGGTGHKGTSVANTPRGPANTAGAFIPLTGGLALGVVVFGLYVWGSGLLGARHLDTGVARPEVARAPDAATVPTPPSRSGLAWLEQAEAPRARVALPPAPPAERFASTEARPPMAATPPPRSDETTAPGAAGSRHVEVASIRFSPNVDQRTVTLRVNGRAATLRQRESIGEVEVQLIMADGVYLQRGSEVFFVTPSR